MFWYRLVYQKHEILHINDLMYFSLNKDTSKQVIIKKMEQLADQINLKPNQKLLRHLAKNQNFNLLMALDDKSLTLYNILILVIALVKALMLIHINKTM